MSGEQPLLLEYRTAPAPEVLGAVGAWPRTTFCLTIFIPGVTSLLLRGRPRLWVAITLFTAIPMSVALTITLSLLLPASGSWMYLICPTTVCTVYIWNLRYAWIDLKRVMKERAGR